MSFQDFCKSYNHPYHFCNFNHSIQEKDGQENGGVYDLALLIIIFIAIN